MRVKGTGSIRQRRSGRWSARWCEFLLGTFDTEEQAEQAILDFRGNKCPYCRRSYGNPSNG